LLAADGLPFGAAMLSNILSAGALIDEISTSRLRSHRRAMPSMSVVLFPVQAVSALSSAASALFSTSSLRNN
jgi:hypothetical protein